MILLILLYSFIAIAAINCLYYLVFSKFSFSKHSAANKDTQTPVSVIVYSKNEAELLPNFLAQFDKQTHSNFELVLINNASSDDTRYIFEDYAKTHPNVEFVNVVNNETFWGSRKYALTLGIKKAKHENLLFTTTSVLFDSDDWITENASLLKDDTQVIVGHNHFEKKGGFTNIFIRFSEIVSNLQNYGTGSITKPYRGSQHNFGYTKSIFFETNGFSNHMSIHEGAEDLFLKQNATTKNVKIATSPVNSVRKKAPNSFSEWLDYKAIQKNISKHYAFSNKFNFRLFGISQVLFFILTAAAIIFVPSVLVFSVIGVRYFITGLVLISTAVKLKDSKPIYLFPLWEIIHSFIQIPIFMRNLSSK